MKARIFNTNYTNYTNGVQLTGLRSFRLSTSQLVNFFNSPLHNRTFLWRPCIAFVAENGDGAVGSGHFNLQIIHQLH